ncbi:DUF3761 domain-containing protein [Arthrobacter sp. KN11-1C]|uniref:DUF3761 domain-containing protein n=1 Tax=Arthrobacter sp. KN11-1C TaxID=3445774 RepID=UPI003F9FD8B2
MAVPAGWYVDAIDPGQQRWWDGNQWTQHVRPQQTEVPIPEIPKHTPALANEKLTHRNLLRRLGPSTYVAAGLFVIALIALAATGYFSTWLVLADIVLLLTGLYTLISGRGSWARFTGRQAGAVAFGGGIVGLVIVPLVATGNYWICLFLIALLALGTGLYTLVSGRRSWARIAGRRIGAVVVGASLVALIASMSAVAATLPAHVKVAASAQSSVSAVRSANPTPTPSSATATPTSRSSPSPTPSPTVTTVPSPFADAVVSGTFAVNASGAVLPDKAATPGATNPKVLQGTINETICLSGWTATVRPDSSLTTTLKLRQLTAGYAYNSDTNPADYEEDHLIPLELGGAPADALNLWPDPYNLPNGARTKDTLENKLHDLVCSGSLPLATAQQAIASDWWAAYETYVAPAPAPAPDPVQAPAPAPAPDPVQAPAPAPAPAPDPVQAPDPGPAPAPAPAPGGGATALCVDGSYSFSATHSGTCSHHKGVAVWYK